MLRKLKATGARILEVDYVNESTIVKAAKEYGTGELDCLINCAGVSPQPFLWDADSGDRLLEMFNIMTVGPYLATKHFLPNLKQSSSPKVANISSEFGCISSNDRGGFLGYRLAKAALNQQTKTIAQAFKEDGNKMIFLALDPGYIATRLTGFSGTDDMDTSVKGMVDIIERAEAADSGLLFEHSGEKLPF
ncbi:hypothetical protein MMC30_005487 [Trapelia coarctata]|nr:hypothetical protein [Trapelia coarctata]